MGMRIGIVGAGAIGCVVGGLLTRAGHTALHLHEVQRIVKPFDAVFVAVKSYDTEWATALGVATLVRPHGVVVDFQNGINDERVAAVAGRERTLGCVILIAAGLYEPGHAVRTDAGSAGFKIGEHDGRDTPRARALADALGAVAPATVTRNLWASGGRSWPSTAWPTRSPG
jgi:2-dehydropantoate 2-reductase